MELGAIFREFEQAAGPLAVTALWQGAVLACGLVLALRLTPRISAADRFKAWAAGFLALLALPLLPLWMARQGGAAADGGPAAPAAAAHPWLALDPRWGAVIAAVWVAASLWRAADLGIHAVKLRRLWKRAIPLDDSGAETPRFSAATSAFKDSGRPGPVAAGRAEICATRELDRPSVIGFFRPRILIPEWLLERLTAQELEQVILHETEHLRRRDDWTNLLQKLSLAVFPLNPALAWMERRLCREREMACDEAVVRATARPRAYAACLASLAERRFERERGLDRQAQALSLGAWRRRPELVDRVHRILRRGPGLHPAAARALLGVVGCGLVLGSVECARCPQLVSFMAAPAVPALETAMVSAGRARMVNARSMGDGSPFRAVDAVAHVPSRAELAREGMAKARRASWSQKPQRDGASGFSGRAGQVRGVKLVAPMTADLADAGAGGARPQQWIVFTAWERVETADGNGRTIADYGVNQTSAARSGEITAGATSNAAAGANPLPAAAPVTERWTYTELIFRIGSARTDPGAAKAGTAPRATAPSLPMPVPMQDGWLVFQL